MGVSGAAASGSRRLDGGQAQNAVLFASYPLVTEI
jgi:hypothetical protein